jgi:hypothetical protein
MPVPAAAAATSTFQSTVLEQITHYSLMLSSDARLPGLLDVLEYAPSDLFWKVIEAEWVLCDDTWEHSERLLRLMRLHYTHAPAMPFRGSDTDLPVFGGCSRSKVHGISWTKDRQIAESFASGHRHIPVPDAVIASTLVPASATFIFIDGRKEAEVLLDPTLLTNVEIDTV